MTEENNKLIIPVTGQEEWSVLADRISEEVGDADLPEKVVKATELLLAGFPLSKVAQKITISPKTIRGWLSRYPTMAAIVANNRKLLTNWRMSQLEQQFLLAVERSKDVLEAPLSGTTPDGERIDPKILTVVAAQARYIIGLFAAQQQSLTVTHELGDTVMKAQDNALSYLAEKLGEQQERAAIGEPIEAVFRVIDASSVDSSGPMLDENGGSPFGEIGELSKDDDGVLCHICGQRRAGMSKHIIHKHNMTVEEYEVLYLLEPGSIRKAEGYWSKDQTDLPSEG